MTTGSAEISSATGDGASCAKARRELKRASDERAQRQAMQHALEMSQMKLQDTEGAAWAMEIWHQHKIAKLEQVNTELVSLNATHAAEEKELKLRSAAEHARLSRELDAKSKRVKYYI